MVYLVVEGRTRLILRYLGLKEFGFQVNRTDDLLVREEVRGSCAIWWEKRLLLEERHVMPIRFSVLTYQSLEVDKPKV